MAKICNKVIVWSIDNFNTLGLMRELGAYDLDLFFLIKGQAGFATRSKYCKSYIETSDLLEGFEYLKNNYLSEQYKPIIITAGDDIVTYLDLHRDELEDRYILPLTSVKGNIEKYVDKNTMTALAQSIGILCPISQKVKWDSTIGNIQYPCIIKPSHERPGHYNEFKFKICKNNKELKRTLKFVHHDSTFILQEYIPKDLDLLVYGGRMRNGVTIIAGTMYRDRLDDVGSASHGYIDKGVPSCVDEHKIPEFLEEIDYYGLFSFEYGMVGDKAYFYEVNLRNDGTSHYFMQAGANIPLAYVYSCAGLDYSAIPIAVQKRYDYIDEIFDVENVINGKISRKQWKQELKAANVFKYYDPSDMEPYETIKKTKLRTIIRDSFVRKYRLYIIYVLDKLGLKK